MTEEALSGANKPSSDELRHDGQLTQLGQVVHLQFEAGSRRVVEGVGRAACG